MFACWVMLAAPHAGADHPRELVLLAVGAALGLGALNEVVEFLAILAHHGAHAGGYWNTGWDFTRKSDLSWAGAAPGGALAEPGEGRGVGSGCLAAIGTRLQAAAATMRECADLG